MSKIPRTICPYCNLGCELGFEVKGKDFRRVEYVKDSRNEGRLCPKGNAAANMINHPRRLYHCLIKGQAATLTEGIDHLKQRLLGVKPEEALLVYDSTLTVEEINSLMGWAEEGGVKNVAYASLGSESAFVYGQRSSLTIEKITSGDFALIAGDAFGQDSVISGYIGKAKGDNRDFRYIVVDSFATKTSHFAHRFVQVKPGYEGLFIYGLYKHIKGDKLDLSSLAEIMGLEMTVFESVAGMIRNKSGIIVNASCRGRSLDPFLTHASSLKLASVSEDSTYIPLGSRIPGKLTRPLYSYMPMVVGGRIKAVVSFGSFFPWNFPQLRPMLRKIDFVAAGSSYIPHGHFDVELVLPMAIEIEKEGTIRNLFGEEKLTGAVPALSGSLPAGAYLERLGASVKHSQKLPSWLDSIDDKGLDDRVKEMVNISPKRMKGSNFLLVGSEPGTGFGSVFDTDNWVMLNSEDASLLNIAEGDELGVKTDQGEAVLEARLSREVGPEIAVISANYPSSLGLFELVADSRTGEGFFKPVWSKIWKK